ncbi:hypothetical protein K458DRAFT_427948 [Lentithecium fluviatile CBS 122367]|uniref:EF-hand domain-containing protein n=1 Tax=Lentithecium fluviatile CBS 122367 TaxID=1168545 RepID=A0A6G1JDN1_9PLEO|nr:hypothetical protein K458DRAFT_427948 [Lentithecium fluviatile CBS 122367]
MSFGFGIGDFVVVSDKAWLIYQKCKSAPEDYATLAHSVVVLAKVLEETKDFVIQGAPSSSSKIEALVSAREGCRTTLNEVDDFLNKYTEIGRKKNRRYIQLAKFITKDVEGLKLKLANNTSLLQLSLTSLSSLSVSIVQKTLSTILQEYRAGTRQRSVLSDAILERKPTPQNDLLEQVSADLEDREVHPDSINFNQSFIRSWLLQASSSGGFDEDSNSQTATPLSLTVATDLTLNDEIHLPYHKNVSFPMANTYSPFERSSQYQDGVFPDNISNRPSEVVEWESHIPAEPESIYNILFPLLETDPDRPPNSTALLHRISEAFRQQDWSHRGLLTRKEVVDTCEEIVKRTASSPEHSPFQDSIPGLVFQFDANKDGQLNEEEYTALMTTIVATITENRHKNTHTRMESVRRKIHIRRKNFRTSLPLHWSNDGALGQLPPISIFSEGVIVDKSWITKFSFTDMYVKCDKYVNQIGDFGQKWIRDIPADFRARLARSLNMVRDAALAFTLFERRDSNLRYLVSDLDVSWICHAILLVPPVSETPESSDETTTSKIAGEEFKMDQLRSAHGTSLEIFCHIENFMIDLMKIRMLDTTGVAKPPKGPTTKQIAEFQGAWKSNDMDYRARVIDETHRKWDEEVARIVDLARHRYTMTALRASALQSVDAHMTRATLELEQIFQTELVHVELDIHFRNLARKLKKDITNRVIRLKLTVEEPYHSWESTKVIFAKVKFKPPYKQTPKLEMHLCSHVTIAVVGVDGVDLTKVDETAVKEIIVFDSKLWNSRSEWGNSILLREKGTPEQESGDVQAFSLGLNPPWKTKRSEWMDLVVQFDDIELGKLEQKLRGPHWTDLLRVMEVEAASL